MIEAKNCFKRIFEVGAKNLSRTMKIVFFFFVGIYYTLAFAPSHVVVRKSVLRESLELPLKFEDVTESIGTVSFPSEPSSLSIALDLPSVDSLTDITSSGEVGPVIGIVAALVIAGIAASTAGGEDTSSDVKPKSTKAAKKEATSEPPIEFFDVSIPYDAAAVLAYLAIKATDKVEDTAEFAKFKTYYESYSVAEVSFKKATREFEAFKSTLTATSAEA